MPPKLFGSADYNYQKGEEVAFWDTRSNGQVLMGLVVDDCPRGDLVCYTRHSLYKVEPLRDECRALLTNALYCSLLLSKWT
jgi:hypothetical protein